VSTRVEGLDLTVFPSVFHPRSFGSSAILAGFVSSLSLRGKTFLEIGCGSGVIALCAARNGADVTAVDINPEAVRCTRANADRHELHIDTQLSDLFSSLDGARFDVIAWNPPFLRGEPKSLSEAAFFGGTNYDVIRRFTNDVRKHLNEGAAVYTILTTDVDLEFVRGLFGNVGLDFSIVLQKRWGLGETMVILCAR
jgi:release factor glutamine methyltransferase